ncbi:MAG TPA: type II toxin-antitoxin system HipA family toxin YjjJ [Vicinamibacterales bacterium]|nr:type II toxin-antitoxin system HipA family toxin YjjJ [Vicinamibacterales bacterium]
MTPSDLIRLLSAAPLRRDELQSRLGVSQPTISRWVAAAGDEVVALGRARATRYARRRPVSGLSVELPVYRIDRAGDVREIGLLIPIHGGVAFDDFERGKADVFAGLPWFVADMRPQGFIGRSFLRHNADLNLPQRLSDWSEDHALVALARRGEDAVGNLIVGEESFERWRREGPPVAMEAVARTSQYPLLAEQALAGELGGSSAGGEQPKFAACVSDASGPRHVLVKFSEPLTTDSGRRWADLLLCEHLALRVMAEAGLPSARSDLLEARGRLFLEVERFDRVGERGRVGLVSLAVLDDEFVGERRDWLSTARALVRQRRISRADLDRIARLQAFGLCIGNTDMHFGNVSLLYEGGTRLDLAPAYDMLPMLYAPVRGEVRTPDLPRPLSPARALAHWGVARDMAVRFWERVAQDDRVSGPFRKIAASNALIVRAA